MSAHQFLKKPKVEPDVENGGGSIGGEANNDGRDTPGDTNDESRSEQEEALVALIQHRTKEVHDLRLRISYYKSQVFISFLVLAMILVFFLGGTVFLYCI